MASHHSIGTGPRSLFSVTRSGSSSKAWRSAAALTLLGLLLPSACGKAEKKAGLIVAVQTDMSIPKDVDAVEIQVSAYGKDIFKRRYNVGKDGDIYIPATITLLPPKDPSTPVTLRVVSFHGGTARTLRRVVTTVPDTREALLRMPISWLCDGQVKVEGDDVASTCKRDASCLAGSCAADVVDSSTLNDFSSSNVFGGETEDVQSTCFDTVPCFAENAPATDFGLDTGSCTLELDGGANSSALDPEKLNFALASSNGAGICGAGKLEGYGCFVPLEREDGSGWSLDGTTVHLPKALCDDPAKTAQLVLSRACATRSPSTPPCGDWTGLEGSSITVPLDDLPDPPGTGGGGTGGVGTGGETTADGGSSSDGGTTSTGGAITGGSGGVSTGGSATGGAGGTDTGGTGGTAQDCNFHCAITSLSSALLQSAIGTNIGTCDMYSEGCGASGDEHVFEFTAPLAGDYDFDTFGSDFDTVLSIYDGTSCSSEISCNDETAPDHTSALTLTLAAGQQVRAVVSGAQGATGNITLTVTPTGIVPGITRASLNSSGVEGNQNSGEVSGVALSSDGRYAAFATMSDNFVAGDSNGKLDVFVRDTQSETTECVSVDDLGAVGDVESGFSSVCISANGRYVAFDSNASNLVPGDTNYSSDVFLRDRQTGTTERISVNDAGVQGDSASGLGGCAISDDGNFVAFTSYATNLVTGDTNGTYDVFVRDRTGNKTERVSVSDSGAEGNAASGEYGLSMSADGNFVAFVSYASTLVSGDTNGTYDAFVRDRANAKTKRVSVDSTGQEVESGLGVSDATISADGKYVAFVSSALNLVSGDTNATYDVFVHELASGATERVSLTDAGLELVVASGDTGIGISGDGRFVAFSSNAVNIVTGDTNGATDIFVRDRLLGTTKRVAADAYGRQTNSDSYDPKLSRDGSRVGFYSWAYNLSTSDTNNIYDVYIAPRP